jgi:transposase-like protein
VPLSRPAREFETALQYDTIFYENNVRKIIYTTDAIESLNTSVRKAVRNKGHFPSDQAATKLIWLALRDITENWKNPPISWHAAKGQLTIKFEERFVLSE